MLRSSRHALLSVPRLALLAGDTEMAVEAIEALRNHLYGPVAPKLDSFALQSAGAAGLADAYSAARDSLSDAIARLRDGYGTLAHVADAQQEVNVLIDQIRLLPSLERFGSQRTFAEIAATVPERAKLAYLLPDDDGGAALLVDGYGRCQAIGLVP
jgi:hypothetical protein